MDNNKLAFDPVVENERRHRIMYTIIVFVLLGIFTILERFLFFYKDNLGLLFGVSFVDDLRPPWFTITAGIAIGILMIISAVFIGFQRIWLPVLAVVILTIDLISPVVKLLNTFVKDSLPLLVIIAVRIACLKWLAQGIMAIWQRQQNASRQADAENPKALSPSDDQNDENI